MKKVIYTLFGITMFANVSCSEDYVKTDQNSTFSDEKVAKLAQFPEAALKLTESVEAGTYSTMLTYYISNTGGHEDFGQKAVDIMMDAMGTDMVFPGSAWFVYHYNYQRRLENNRPKLNYNYYAKLAHNANLILQFASKSNPDYVNSPIYGRALAIRAFANFSQLRMYAYGDLGISYQYVDFADNSELKLYYNRVPTQEVYSFIEKDLLEAERVLVNFSSKGNKGIIDGSVVSGLLSRFYLEQKDWQKAKEYAFKALESNLEATNFNMLNDGFSQLSNRDVMWGAEINGSNTTVWASFFSHMDSQNQGYGSYTMIPKLIDERLYAQIDEKDKRKKWFYNGEDILVSPSTGATITGNNLLRLANLKFVDKTNFLGDYIYMRKSEMLLNYSEAAFESGDEAGSKTALNNLMESRQVGYSSDQFTGDRLRAEIRLQRRIELWGEGFGLFDIKRWGIGVDRKSDLVLSSGKVIKSGHGLVPGTDFNYPANSDQLRFQFPIDEINANKQLRPQNP